MSITKMLRKLVRRPKKKPTRRNSPGACGQLAKLDKEFEKAEDLLVRKFAIGRPRSPRPSPISKAWLMMLSSVRDSLETPCWS